MKNSTHTPKKTDITIMSASRWKRARPRWTELRLKANSIPIGNLFSKTYRHFCFVSFVFSLTFLYQFLKISLKKKTAQHQYPIRLGALQSRKVFSSQRVLRGMLFGFSTSRWAHFFCCDSWFLFFIWEQVTTFRKTGVLRAFSDHLPPPPP